ncbi:dephospho-CoA kinase [bacterium]|nr:MAG: dephospho-CoA kinase [bacterium]
MTIRKLEISWETMLVIAITGGIGSGKSTVRRIFQEMGAVGIDADELARRVVEPGSKGAREVREAFGPSFFDEQGELKRKEMAELVFSDPSARKKLEAILHPKIRAEESRMINDACRKDPDAIIAVEVPLLAETGSEEPYDVVVSVIAPESVRLDRLAASGRYKRPEAQARIGHQTEDEARTRIADYVIDNSGTQEETASQVKAVLSVLKKT